MAAVTAAEQALGHAPKDVSAGRIGYDIESGENGTSRLRFTEVKGHAEGSATVMVTRNEVLAALNKPDAFILAAVEVANGVAGDVHRRGIWSQNVRNSVLSRTGEQGIRQ